MIIQKYLKKSSVFFAVLSVFFFSLMLTFPAHTLFAESDRFTGTGYTAGPSLKTVQIDDNDEKKDVTFGPADIIRFLITPILDGTTSVDFSTTSTTTGQSGNSGQKPVQSHSKDQATSTKSTIPVPSIKVSSSTDQTMANATTSATTTAPVFIPTIANTTLVEKDQKSETTAPSFVRPGLFPDAFFSARSGVTSPYAYPLLETTLSNSLYEIAFILVAIGSLILSGIPDRFRTLSRSYFHQSKNLS